MKLKNWLKLEKEDIDKRIRSYSRFRLLLFASLVFGFLFSIFWLWGKTYSPAIAAFDKTALQFVSQYKTKKSPLINLFSLVTIFGSGYLIAGFFLLLALILFRKRRRRAAVVVLATLIGSSLVNFMLRELFARPRPEECLPTIFGYSCFSFPSGHTTAAIYFYGVLNYLIFRFMPMPLKSYLLVSLFLLALIVLIGASRVFLAVHYPSDVLGGYFLGSAWLILAVFLIDILY